MKKAAIFDLDGTLVDTLGIHRQAWQELFGHYDIALTAAQINEQSGKKNETFVRIIADRYQRTDLDPVVLAREKDMIVMDIISISGGPVFPGVQEILDGLGERHIPIALATSATKATAQALAPHLIPLFDVTLCSEDVSRGKPDPEIFLKAAHALGVPPQDCIVFEDASSGVGAAKAAGCMCIARDNGAGQDLIRADQIVTQYIPKEILAYFL